MTLAPPVIDLISMAGNVRVFIKDFKTLSGMKGYGIFHISYGICHMITYAQGRVKATT